MGVASYREDIYLQFLESTARAPDFIPPGPPDQICPFCGDRFKDQRRLVEHLSSAHRGDRPVLLLYGREPDRHCQIAYRLRKENMLIQNCTSARLRIDGHETMDVPSSRVGSLLASAVDSIVDLELANRFDNSAEPVRQAYHLTIRVPPKRALDDVDRAFVHHLGTAAPHMAQVSRFLEDPRCQGIVWEYADALAGYVRGVLVKDQDRATGVTLRPAEAADLYGDALGRLRSFQRLLPNVICGLVRFAMNDFSFSEQPTGVIRLDRAIAFLAPLVGRKGPRRERMSNSATARTIALCPVDHGVDRVLRLGASLNMQRRWGPLLQQECRDAASAPMMEAADRQKVLAIWGAAALRLSVPYLPLLADQRCSQASASPRRCRISLRSRWPGLSEAQPACLLGAPRGTLLDNPAMTNYKNRQ
jgi:hypothetical protein